MDRAAFVPRRALAPGAILSDAKSGECPLPGAGLGAELVAMNARAPVRSGRPALGAARRVLFLALVAAASLSIVELGFRVATWVSDRYFVGTLDDLARVGARSGPLGVPLAALIRRSPNPRLVYELRPDLHVRFVGQDVVTNAGGMRGPPTELRKQPGTVRIVGLGDSYLFGWGVRQGAGVLEQLTARLAERHADVRWEAVNTAVPGYNTAMEVEMLADRALAFDPDLVVLDWVRNDVDLPNFLWRPRSLFGLGESFALTAARNRVAGLPALGFPIVEAPLGDRGREYQSDPARVPAEYRYMVGVEGVRGALERLVGLRAAHGFELVITAHARVPPRIEEVFTSLDVPFVRCRDALNAYASSHGTSTRPGSPLTVSATDPHLSELGHGVCAGAYAAELASSGLDERLVARARRGSGRGRTSRR